MEVVKGQVAVLHAWYSPGSDISKNSVTWQFLGNRSKPVRRHLLRIKLFPELGLNLRIAGLLLKSESPILKLHYKLETWLFHSQRNVILCSYIPSGPQVLDCLM